LWRTDSKEWGKKKNQCRIEIKSRNDGTPGIELYIGNRYHDGYKISNPIWTLYKDIKIRNDQHKNRRPPPQFPIPWVRNEEWPPSKKLGIAPLEQQQKAASEPVWGLTIEIEKSSKDGPWGRGCTDWDDPWVHQGKIYVGTC
jgi:hypothetical protein